MVIKGSDDGAHPVSIGPSFLHIRLAVNLS